MIISLAVIISLSGGLIGGSTGGAEKIPIKYQ
jgi:hypothetical protein